MPSLVITIPLRRHNSLEFLKEVAEDMIEVARLYLEDRDANLRGTWKLEGGDADGGSTTTEPEVMTAPEEHGDEPSGGTQEGFGQPQGKSDLSTPAREGASKPHDGPLVEPEP